VSQPRLIDTHAHLNDAKFADDVAEVLARASEAGVERINVCGYDLESSAAAVELAGRFESVYATVGIHPHDAKSYDANAEREIEELSRASKVLAIGEIGLDFHYDFSPRGQQVAAFEAQIDLAGRLGLPIVVHSRESNPEALQVLRGRARNIVGCVFHCFSGDSDFAQSVLEMGFYIGIDGPVTYKASEKLRGIVETCPLDRLLVETDCPYLTPVPHRGHRNEPAYVRYVAEEVARVKGISLHELAEATCDNARRLFAAGKGSF
jgi:TatD DNase family protein